MGKSMDDKASILIVDDEMGMCETLSDILEDMGYHVAIAVDGYEAIEKVKGNVFDIILMDVKMPGMDGVDTFKKIRELHPETVVIMMTAYAVEDRVREALREGAYGVLYKPLDMEKMIGFVEGIKVGGRILVVDDDPDTYALFKDILEPKGYQVSAASSGEEAIERVWENRYDMVFIEMKLPVMDGLHTYLAIREINPQVVAVMMTAYYREATDLVVEALMNEAYTCLYKPFDMERVVQLVEEIYHRKRQSGEQ